MVRRVSLLLMFVILIIPILLFPISFASKQIIMKIGHSMPTATPRHRSLLLFKNMVESRSNHAVKVEIYPASQLGSESEMIAAVKMGALEGSRAGCFDEVSSKLLIYTLPFLFDKVEDVYKIARGPIGEKIARSALKNGIIVIATGDCGGFRQLTNNTKPIEKPEDLKGLKMRTPPVETTTRIMETLGATPISIQYTDTYLSLKTGEVDGQENPFINLVAMKFHEVQKYITICNYQIHPETFYVSKLWYDSLEAYLQKILRESAREMMILSDQFMKEDSVYDFEVIKKSMEVTVLNSSQKQAFIQKVQPVYDYFIRKGVFTKEEINEIRRALKK